MDEVYIEQLVKEDKQLQGILLRVAMIVGSLILWFLAFISPIRQYILILVTVLCCLVVWIFWRRVMREYEYIYTNGHLDVDVIFSRMSRKHLVSIDCRELQLLASAQEPRYQHLYQKKYTVEIHAGTGTIGEGTYIALAKKGEKTLKLVFDPNERLLAAIKKYSPHNTVLAGSVARPVELD